MRSLSSLRKAKTLPLTISVLFHPFLLGTAAFAVIIFIDDTAAMVKLLYFLIAVMAIVIVPLVYVVKMKRSGGTSSIDIPERELRSGPFIIGIVTYLVALFLFWILKAPAPLMILMWAYAFNTTVATLITSYWKISIHGMGVGGPVAALGYVVSPGFYWVFLIVPILTYSRVSLKAHTVMQVIAGFVLGFLLTLTHYKILMPI